MSRFLPDHGAVLVLHIPRCGGTFIELSLKKLGIHSKGWLHNHPHWLPSKHLTISQYDYYLLKDVQFVAAFVRHPIHYYEATWRYLKDIGPTKRRRISRLWTWHPQMYPSRYWVDDFNEWAMQMCRHRPGWVTRLYELYCGPDGGEWCDWIGRTETINEDLVGLLAAVGKPLNTTQADFVRLLKPENSAAPHKIHWDRYVRLQVEQFEHLAIQRFYGKKTADKRKYAKLDASAVNKINPRLAPPCVRKRMAKAKRALESGCGLLPILLEAVQLWD